MKILNLLEKEAVNKPRILLLDFSKAEAQSLRECGYQVYEGSSGFDGGEFNIPVEIYRIDIVLYKMDYSLPKPKPGQTIKLHSIVTHKSLAFKGESYKENPASVWFTEPPTAKTSYYGFSSLSDLTQKVIEKGGSVFAFLGDLRIDEDVVLLKTLIELPTTARTVFKKGNDDGEFEVSFQSNLSYADIGEFFKELMKDQYMQSLLFIRGIPYKHLKPSIDEPESQEFLAQDEANIVYSYLKHYTGNKGNIGFLQSYGNRNIPIIKQLLTHLQKVSPADLFSRNFDNESWLEGQYYKFGDEVDVLEKKQQISIETEKNLGILETERLSLREKTDFFRALLINGDDDKSELDDQLKPVVKKVLEWLDIKVVDVDADQKKKEQPLINDLLLSYDGESQLCEVKGVKCGPRGDYIQQVQSHIIRYSKQNEAQTLPGLLILNYQRDIDASSRSEFYTDPAYIKMAEDADIGLLDTRELFKICKDIYGNPKASGFKKKACELLMKKKGVITWNPIASE